MRRGGIGASEMPILLGESEWGSVLSMWAEKRGEYQKPDEDSELMELGRELEPSILRILGKRSGVRYHDTLSRKLLRSLVHPWAIATPDSVTENLEPVEVKNLAHGYEEEAWSEQIPEKYRIQVHHQMLVMGAQRALFGTLVWGAKFVWEWVPRDDALIRRIVKAGSEFWKHVEDGTEPPSDGNRHARQYLQSKATNDTSVELHAHEVYEPLTGYIKSSTELAGLRKRSKAAEKQRDACADRIAQLMGGARSGYTLDGWSFAWKRTQRNGYTVEPRTLDMFTIKEPKR
jgi:putative phage-type endonuclease